jgi:hypothetical protein
MCQGAAGLTLRGDEGQGEGHPLVSIPANLLITTMPVPARTASTTHPPLGRFPAVPPRGYISNRWMGSLRDSLASSTCLRSINLPQT